MEKDYLRLYQTKKSTKERKYSAGWEPSKIPKLKQPPARHSEKGRHVKKACMVRSKRVENLK